MDTFIRPLEDYSSFKNIKKHISDNIFPIAIDGCVDTQKSHAIYSLSSECKNTLIITADETRARKLYEDYSFFNGEVYLYPGKDVIFFNANIKGNLLIENRMKVVRNLIDGAPSTVITTLDGVMDRLFPLEKLADNTLTLRAGDIITIDELSEKLTELGFIRNFQVEAPGEYAIRGGILDIFNLSDEVPCRIEFWDDEVDSIRSFDVSNQRSIANMDEFTIYPVSEYIFTKEEKAAALAKIEEDLKVRRQVFEDRGLFKEADRLQKETMTFVEAVRENAEISGIENYLSYFDCDFVSLLDYFSDGMIFVDESIQIEDKARALSEEFLNCMEERSVKGYILPAAKDILYSSEEILNELNYRKTIFINNILRETKTLNWEKVEHINVRSVNSYNSDFKLLVKDLTAKKAEGYRVALVCASKTRGKRLEEDLAGYDLWASYSEDREKEIAKGEIMICRGNLHRGLEYPDIKFSVISESDIFGEIKKKRKKKTEYKGEKIGDFSNLHVGDIVVHESHGIGVYMGVEQIEVDRVLKDYIKIQYADDGNLYIPATSLHLIQKYAAAGEKRPRLNKLGSVQWKNTKSKVSGAVKDLAKEMIALYAARENEQGFAFSEDSVWQREFEETFPYEETMDQLHAIADTKHDMESTRIMDRLICGDVGYGKTEVAIRAAFKACLDGKQVAILVPTTILAQQHFKTFAERFKGYPINIELLCRFRTAAQQKDTVARLKKGSVDVVIGTHRLLSKDVEFKNLGLLIVDEEQRFGVTHKERIKQIKTNVDVLTLSATPIPRTLHMGLVGIRDMSILEEPPQDRIPVQTYVLEYNEEIVREAIIRETNRGGQVYYVYNNISSIEEVANRIKMLVPDLTVTFAHGRMKETELENIMYSFIEGDIDVLVSTTIIETGLDIPNVNTMIIHDADKMGLSQLYQLRGRIGRSNRMSYAFMMFRKDKILKEIADKRLKAIKEFTQLGSGFKLAMRDLELRGAGNLLGSQQSGHMESVGYDLYCKLLSEAVRGLKGEDMTVSEYDTEIDVNVDAYIPSTYIKNEIQKLDMYKRISNIETKEEYEEIEDELMDRFGDIPQCAMNLLKIALIKADAHRGYITSIKHNDREMVITMFERAKVDVTMIPKVVEQFKGRMSFRNGKQPYFIYKPDKKDIEDPLKCEFLVIKSLASLINED